MDKKLLQELKERLEKEKATIEKELEKFAKKDEKLKGDWDTRFPQWDGKSGGSAMEEEADEVEEYSTLLPIEHSLEKKLQDVNLALENIKKGKYGICRKCHKPIEIERLKIYPEAKTCVKCREKS
jgi:RNA polymerase-binding transcription factor DksA